MSKETHVSDFGKCIDKTKLLMEARLYGYDVVIDGWNDGKEIKASSMSLEVYVRDWVVPVWTDFIDGVVKSAKFNTTVTGTYESETLNATETLNSVENTYGS